MRYDALTVLAVCFCLFLLPGCGSVYAEASDGQGPASPQDALVHDWADDPIWHDGKAEIARYDAVRVIYGQPRAYTATLYTNKENLDLDTRTKAAGPDAGAAPVVFKHHARDENIPTPAYAYDFSSMAYVDADTLGMWKLEVSSQEDCGTTFKQYWHDGNTLSAFQSSYFPDEGRVETTHDSPSHMVFHDALPLILRGYPFEQPLERPMRLNLVVDQTHNHLSASRPRPYAVTYEGRRTLDLPIGTVDAHHLKVSPVQRDVPPPGGEASHYFFAADGNPPMLHALVQYRGPFGTSYELKSHERGMYWAR